MKHTQGTLFDLDSQSIKGRKFGRLKLGQQTSKDNGKAQGGQEQQGQGQKPLEQKPEGEQGQQNEQQGQEGQQPKEPGKAETDREKIKQQPEAESKDSPIEQGLYESVKEEAKKKDQTTKKLQTLLDNSQKVLFRTSAIFPFDLFPDEISIDFNKVNILSNDFFGTGRVHSVFIKDISDVFVYETPFFSTLEIIDAGFVENSIKVKFLSNENALKARRIIQGLVVASKQEIDLTALDMPDIIKKLEELGQIKE